MKFAVPRLWRETSDHVQDCYFCIVNPSKCRPGENAENIFYSPIPNGENFPVPFRLVLDNFGIQSS